MTLEERELIQDNLDVIRAGVKVMHQVVDRHIQKLLTESIEDGQGVKLVLLRAKIDGMKGLIYEYEQLIKSNRP